METPMTFQEHWDRITKDRACFNQSDRDLASLFYSKGHIDGAREVLAASAKNFAEQLQREQAA